MTYHAQSARRPLRAAFRPGQEEPIRSLVEGRGSRRRPMRRLSAAVCALMMLAGSAIPATGSEILRENGDGDLMMPTGGATPVAGREARLRRTTSGPHDWDCDYEPTQRAARVTVTESTLTTGFMMLCWDEAQTKYARCREWQGGSRQVWRLTTVGAALAGFEWNSKFDPDGDGVPCEWVVGWAELPDRFYVDLVGGGHIRFDLPPTPAP